MTLSIINFIVAAKSDAILKHTFPSLNETAFTPINAFLHQTSKLLKSDIGFKLCIRSEIPIGSGLGSSASYAVVMATSLLLLSNTIESISKDSLHIINSHALTLKRSCMAIHQESITPFVRLEVRCTINV